MVAFSVIAFFGMVALVVGIIGLIVSAIRHTKKTRWLIVLLVGLAVAIIFTVAYGVTRDDETSDTTEETVVEEEVVAEEESEPSQEVTEEEITEEPAEEVVEEPAEVSAATWTVSDNGFLFDENIVSGDAKSVTIEFIYNSNGNSVFAQYEFQTVTIGNEIYRFYDDSPNGFEGLPIVTKVNDSQYDYFVASLGAFVDQTNFLTLTMVDGSDLPDSIVINYNASETRNDPLKGGNTIDRYRDLTLTIEHN